MSNSVLTQSEADAPFHLEKKYTKVKSIAYPHFGGSVVVPLVSLDEREHFFLDIRRREFDLSRGSYQKRVRHVIVLARLDFNRRLHRNPDGTTINSPHLHLYREGFNDKWAFPVPRGKFTNLNDPWIILKDFLIYCNVVKPPLFHTGVLT